jgi:hypothetical protein
MRLDFVFAFPGKVGLVTKSTREEDH